MFYKPDKSENPKFSTDEICIKVVGVATDSGAAVDKSW